MAEEVAYVPVMRVRVQASGQPTWDDTRETVIVSAQIAAGRPNIRAATVSGLCMEPYVMSGERIVFDPDAHPQDRDMVVVTDEDGSTMVKWFRVDPLGRAYLRAADGTTIRPNGAKVEGVVLTVVRQALRDPEP
jgi:SOS-response transcriptional repressor LexA